ncbi:MAG TPA: glycosyl hydrolase family 65 protein [Puia sp.]|nr:glycosyl hydrolase family 65 protein [Puia sp.]
MKKILITAYSFFLVFYCSGQVLDKRKVLAGFNFWSNRDFDWYARNIPLIETPDRDIDETYYYRWELITAHLVYGSPSDGYSCTEFINSPWWSGTYGAISCAAGLQLYELRWSRDPRYAEDYARYWFSVPGAEPRNYSTWLGDAIWQVYKSYGNRKMVSDLERPLIRNYMEWEKEHFIPREGLFAWDGMHDGMETNINSRQTKNWFSGAQGYRPTLNSYMWADARAIGAMALLNGDSASAELFYGKARELKIQFQAKCWDPERRFFFHRFMKDEDSGILANTLTYQSGRYKGNEHGREELGFIPWYFNMPDAGYEQAWQYLMDSARFFAKFGPTTVERDDPLFHVAKSCCAWSGNTWPYATSQTLRGMANLLRYYKQGYVTKEDYFRQLKIFTETQRKDGRPYIAEANNPFTGSWEGHDKPGHSEHYFHSSYIDLVLNGLLGIEPMASDSMMIDPLIPRDWNYFIIDGLRYHRHDVTVIWDRTGRRYGKGRGFSVWVDGKRAASFPSVRRLVLPIMPGNPTSAGDKRVNVAVNNSPSEKYPFAFASSPGIGAEYCKKMNDGAYWYYERTPNRWSSIIQGTGEVYAGIDLGGMQQIDEIKVYFTENVKTLAAPVKYMAEYWQDGQWRQVHERRRVPAIPAGNCANTVWFEPVKTRKIKLRCIPVKSRAIGISEIEAWGDGYVRPPAGETEKDGTDIDSLSASFISKFDDGHVLRELKDGAVNPSRRWTAYGSSHEEDWVELYLSRKQAVHRLLLYFYDDKGGVQPPVKYDLYCLDGDKGWRWIEDVEKMPKAPGADLNTVSFKPVLTDRLKIVLRHRGDKIFSGLYGLSVE